MDRQSNLRLGEGLIKVVKRKKLRDKMRNTDKMAQIFKIIILVNVIFISLASGQLHNNNIKRQKRDNVVAEMQVLCHNDAIVLKVNTNTPFNGMLYAKDAPGSNNCVSEFHSTTNMTFRLPLKSCGTLYAEVDDGIEYFNTVVVQPHMRLMTNQGKGYHIRCKYQTRERTIANTHFNVSAAFLMQNGPQASTTPILATASMPSCTMKIFRSGREDVAETVKIGDKLIMVIEIDQQDMYGMKISNCVVRDGMNMAEQLLINEQGCPLDETIMPKFDYTNNYTRAAVSFPAHKFPHTSSVYYQCNVRLCINNGNCDLADCAGSYSSSTASNSLLGSASSSAAATTTLTTPAQSPSSTGAGAGPRRKRFAGAANHLHGNQAKVQTEQWDPMASMLPQPSKLTSGKASRTAELVSSAPGDQISFDVYSGLYVSDVDTAEASSANANANYGQQPTFQGGDLSPDSSSPEASAQADRLDWHRAGLLIAVASCASLGLVLLLACQAGLVGSSASPLARPVPSAMAAEPYHLAPARGQQKEAAFARLSQQQAFHTKQQQTREAKQLYGIM